MNNFSNKVLAVLNDIEALDTVLKRAVSLSEEKKAILEVLFVHEEKIFGLPDFFRFKETSEKDVADNDKIKKEIENKLTTPKINAKKTSIVALPPKILVTLNTP